ncbi:restriction endonuclease subunit S [Glaciecola sp. SC05]|uniref:restriction endonuclease subunit S n=1 Tax=Glaciecola sp. SC05 TaxID=1987355 RepID=UPI003528B9B5
MTLPKSWIGVTLDDVCNKITDGTHKTPNYQSSGVRFISIKNIKPFKKIDWDRYEKYISYAEHEELTKRCNPEFGDILFPRIGTLGYAKRIDFEETVSLFVGLGLLKPNHKIISSQYLEYWMNSPEINKLSHQRATGSGRLTLALAESKKLPVPLTSILMQKKIVEKIEELFSHIDAGVEGLKQAKAKLQQYRQSVLKDAVTGKLTEQWREKNADKLEPADKLLERILDERRTNWEAEQLKQFEEKGKIPKDDKWKAKYVEPKAAVKLDSLPIGWVSTVTDQVFSFVTSGSRGWAKYYSDDGPLFLRVGNLFHYNVELDLRKLQRVSPPKDSEGSRTKVQEGDNLISITADVGMVGYVPKGFEEAYINQHVALARPVQKVMGKYLSWLLSGDFAKKQFKALQKGATKAGLGLDDIKSISFGLPSILEQEKIVDEIEVKISGLDKLKKEIEQKLLHASKLKSSILADAFSGRLVENTDSNETAVQLLEKIKAEKQLLEEKAKLAKNKPNARAKKMEKRPIIDVLKASKNALKVEELFEQAGFQNDVSPEGIEAFYQELKIVAEDSNVDVSPIMLKGRKQGDKFKYREVKENEAG